MNIYQYELSNLVDKGFNTKSLQMESLLNFMVQLGFRYTRKTESRRNTDKGSGRFTRHSGKKFISFNDAVILHNNTSSICKLVKQVKLQRKKGGQIIVQSNFVKLVNNE
mgnify:CR=1 FL=1